MGWSLGIDGKVVDDLCNFGGWSEIKTLVAQTECTLPELAQFAQKGISGSPTMLHKEIVRFLERDDLPDWVEDVLQRLADNIEKHPDAEAVYVSDGVNQDEGFEESKPE
ncbi:MAG: hypothetical protein QM758_01380 [Armatimonas sp.]